jgi:DNA repair protein RadD
MYRTLLAALRDDRPDMRVAGLSATTFRLDSGRLDQGDEKLFSEIVYTYGIGDGIRDGWLSGLISKASATEIDVTGVAKRGGEFVAGALEAAADDDRITRLAAAELVELGRDRKSWLAFCSGIKHALHVRDALRDLCVRAETVTGETPAATRAHLIGQFRAGHIRCLTNAQVLTTGFDAPNVDLIAFLRPTLSTGLYLQMVGRGTRPVYPPGFNPDAASDEERREAVAAGPKGNCLVLDFAGNVRRHGPVDAVLAPRAKSKADDDDGTKVGVDTVRAKECPECHSLVALVTHICPHCGHVWPAKPKHAATADTMPILSTERREPEFLPVISWSAKRHEKAGSPDSLCVSYSAGLMTHREWICFEHSGYARRKAESWWARHAGGPPPATIGEALDRFGSLRQPSHISVVAQGKFFEIVNRRFDGVSVGREREVA